VEHFKFFSEKIGEKCPLGCFTVSIFSPTWVPTSASSRAQELDLTSKLAYLVANWEFQLRLTVPVSHQSGYVTPNLRIRDKISCLVVHS
jgi:hypothetical protein